MMTLLGFLHYFYDDTEQPLLPSRSTSRSTSGQQESNPITSGVVLKEHGQSAQQHNNDLRDSERPDSPLSLPFDGQHGQSKFLRLNIDDVQLPNSDTEFNDIYCKSIYNTLPGYLQGH
jgi:hypothetical protein